MVGLGIMHLYMENIMVHALRCNGSELIGMRNEHP